MISVDRFNFLMQARFITFLQVAIILSLGCSNLYAQKSKKISQNTFAIDVDTGLSFADFNEGQSQWRPNFYPTLSLSLLGNRRLNARFDVDYGAGGTFYYLINRGPVDKYVLDFASPYIIAGLGYSFMQTHRQENFVKIQAIAQLGYNDVYRDVFEAYTVDVESSSKYYYSIKAQFGKRRFMKRGSKKKMKKVADEYGVMFRFSLQNLGTATFVGDNYTNVVSPTGDIGGFYYRILFDYGGKKVKRNARQKQEKMKEVPPVIFNPRF